MNRPANYSFTRYLTAKKSVDDRALNKDVWQALANSISAGSVERPLQIIETGAGIGIMVERMLEWGLFNHAEYTALDARIENIEALPNRLRSWAEQTGAEFSVEPDGALLLEHHQRTALVRGVSMDVFEYAAAGHHTQSFDLLVAHAFLDLLNVPAALPQLLRLVRPGGWFYFTINFDGMTHFEPPIDPELEARIERLYHASMDERRVDDRPSGDSRTGRHLFENLRRSGAKITHSGASDWVVFAGPSGYQEDEAYFLHFILHTIEEALFDHPELDPGRLEEWANTRHAQVAQGDLIYIAHQLDFLGQAA